MDKVLKLAPEFVLNNGVKMPSVALGTFQLKDQKTMTDLLRASFDLGYRHLDTAVGYGNHKQIGSALKTIFSEGKYKREHIFITTKLFPEKDLNALAVLKTAIEDLNTTYVDQFLVHWPLGTVKDGKIWHKPQHVIWPEMEDCYELGLTKSIGVSNYNVQSLINILSFCQIKPHVNQIEFSIFYQPWSLAEFCQQFDIVVVGYSNLARGGADCSLVLGNQIDLFNEPTLLKISQQRGQSIAQIVLRFLQQQGIVVLPKTQKVERLRENFDIFDFQLSQQEIQEIRQLNQNLRTIDPTSLQLFSNLPVFD